MNASNILIHGEWLKSYSKATLDAINPSTGIVINKISNCGEQDVDKAVRSALIGLSAWKIRLQWIMP